MPITASEEVRRHHCPRPRHPLSSVQSSRAAESIENEVLHIADNGVGTFTPPTLKPYNGENNMPVYLAVRGKVFDVTPGRNFYGPGGPYENFAGRDATRGLACGSFDEDMLTKDLNGPLDDLNGLGPSEMEALQGWEE